MTEKPTPESAHAGQPAVDDLERLDPFGLKRGAFEILLAWSDRVLQVRDGQTALEVLVAAGVPITPGCEVGHCGECATQYVEGDVIHRDVCLSGPDREHQFCPCVSRARTRIVLAI